MGKFDPVVMSVVRDQPVELAELRIALGRQAVQFDWWLIDLSERPENREMVRSWNDIPWLHAISAQGHPNELCRRAFKLIQEGLLMLIDPGYRLDSELLIALTGFLRFNREKMGAYVPVSVGGEQKPERPAIFGPNDPPLVPTACAMFRVDRLKEIDPPWEDLLQEFCDAEPLWPALTGRALLSARPADASRAARAAESDESRRNMAEQYPTPSRAVKASDLALSASEDDLEDKP